MVTIGNAESSMQGIEVAPAQRAPFDPNKLTVPQSPAFATRARLRAQVTASLTLTHLCMPEADSVQQCQDFLQ